MNIISTHDLHREAIHDFFIDHWGSPQMVISTGIYNCSELDGFAVLNDNQEIIGLITYIIKAPYCEIISLDSVEEKKGIGTALLTRLETFAQEHPLFLLLLLGHRIPSAHV